MARPRKIQPAIEIEVTTAETGIKEILATSVEKTFEEAATYVNVSNFKLRDMFCDRLGTDEPTAWETVPTEHESLLDEFKRQMEAAATVKSHELPPVVEPEIPMVSDEPEAPKAKKGGNPKQKSGALTKTRKAAIEQAAESVKQTGRTHEMATSTLAVQKGTRKGAKLAALELQAEDAAYEHVKRQGLQRKIAKLQDELLDEENFDPNELLAALGVPTTQETQAELDELVGNVLGKLQTATTEILDNSWANGYDLDAATLNLDRLMNSYE